jgi:hypothetical protein
MRGSDDWEDKGKKRGIGRERREGSEEDWEYLGRKG